MKKLEASYIGWGTYLVTVKTRDGESIRKIFREPFLKDPKNYEVKIASLAKELCTDKVKVDKRDLYNRIRQAAEREGRDFPNLLVK